MEIAISSSILEDPSSLEELAATGAATEELGLLSTVLLTCVVSLSAALGRILAAFARSSVVSVVKGYLPDFLFI